MCRIAITSPTSVSNTTGFFLITPQAIIATCGWLIIGVPIRFPNVPTLVMVIVPPLISSGFSCPSLALEAKSLTALVMPTKFLF